MKMKEETSTSSRTKRRRTTSTTPNKLEPSMIDIWKLEEEQAVNRDVDKEYQLARQACGNVKRLLKELLELKLNRASSVEKSEKRIHFLMLILMLKKFNRLDKIHNKKSRDLTNEVKSELYDFIAAFRNQNQLQKLKVKAKVDAHHLKLLNLLYEITHLTKEVNKCLEFKSRDEDIKLISVEEFYKVAPLEISKLEATKNDNHALTLSRLDYELIQRKKLTEKFKESETSKERLLQEIKKKEEYLDSLAPSLQAILQATIPVQDRLGMKQETKRRQHKLANLLPPPLFILFVKMNAYAEAWDNCINVMVEGDYDEAKAIKQPTEEKDEESGGESDQEDSTRNNTRYRRSTTDHLGETRKKILARHPLTVSSIFKCSNCVLKLKFFYLVTLDVITVETELKMETNITSLTINVMTDSLLEYLLGDDSGKDTPNEANHYQLQRWGMDDFKSYIRELGRPFMWAQRLAGLDFIRTVGENTLIARTHKPDANLSGSCMNETITAIKTRIKDRIHLQNEICNLERGEISHSMVDFHRVNTKLTSFVHIIWEDYKDSNLTGEMISSGIVNNCYFTFKAGFERSSAKLTALVAVSPHYPSVAPVFVLQLDWNGTKTAISDVAVQELEKEVNVYWKELVDENRLLSCQIYRLMLCFDLYLETETAVYDSRLRSGAAEFPREKNVVYLKSGRDRSKPYKYVKNLGLFLHR